MNPNKQRIAIAEACGLSTKQEQLGGVLIYRDKRGHPVPSLPDYLNDLNAMHEAEKVLNEAQHYEYAGILGGVAQADLEGGDLSDLYVITHATAAQRAEAFLRTIGKWEGA